jgi:hypothetical protein
MILIEEFQRKLCSLRPEWFIPLLKKVETLFNKEQYMNAIESYVKLGL